MDWNKKLYIYPRVALGIVLFFLLLWVIDLSKEREKRGLTNPFKLYILDEKNEDVCLLSSLITSECGTCTAEEKYLVGSVVLNRMDAERICIYDVLTKKNQFAGINTENFYPTEESNRIAIDLLKGKGRDRRFLYFFTGQPCWSLSLVCVNDSLWHHTFSY